MRLRVQIEGDLRRVMEASCDAVGKAVIAAVTETAEDWKNELRSQVVSAGLGQRLANTWRSKAYPNNGINATAVVYSSASVIMGAFANGAVISGKNGLWLAIPTHAAPKMALGKRVTPANLERAWGVKLRFIYRRDRPSLLAADVRTGFKVSTVPMFILVRQVTLRKRLDLVGVRNQAENHLKTALANRLYL